MHISNGHKGTPSYRWENRISEEEEEEVVGKNRLLDMSAVLYMYINKANILHSIKVC